MDELAQAAGQDPLEFRRKLLAQASEEPRGAQRRGREGRLGQAGAARHLPRPRAHEGLRRYVAAAAEISVDDGNKIKVHRIVAATDPIHAVNPAQIDRQVAGSFVYGLSALFLQECTVKDGRIVEDQLRHLQLDADRRDAEGRVDHHADRRQRSLGRRRRADHLRGGTCGAQRVLQGDRQAHPFVPAEEPRHQHGLSKLAKAAATRPPLLSFRGLSACKRCVFVAIVALARSCRRRRRFAAEAPPGARRAPAATPRAPASRRRCRGLPAAMRPRSWRPDAAFRTASAAGTVMDRIAKGFTDAEIQAIAAWYARAEVRTRA